MGGGGGGGAGGRRRGKKSYLYEKKTMKWVEKASCVCRCDGE